MVEVEEKEEGGENYVLLIFISSDLLFLIQPSSLIISMFPVSNHIPIEKI